MQETVYLGLDKYTFLKDFNDKILGTMAEGPLDLGDVLMTIILVRIRTDTTVRLLQASRQFPRQLLFLQDLSQGADIRQIPSIDHI